MQPLSLKYEEQWKTQTGTIGYPRYAHGRMDDQDRQRDELESNDYTDRLRGELNALHRSSARNG
jgi:hypothetical protein